MKIVVTGMGMVTPVGDTVAATWASLLAARSGVGPIGRFDASTLPVRFAAEVAAQGDEDQAALKLRLARTALDEALAQSGALPYLSERIGVCLGSEAARPELSVIAQRLRSGTLPTLAEFERGAPRAPTELVARRLGASGPVSTVSTACTSSSQAVGEGVLRLRRCEVDAMVVGGVDALVDPMMVTGFSLLGALSTRNDDPQAASRPFDVSRDGFVLGEGAGMLVLEREDGARARGAVILAELRGWGCSCNAYRITDSPPDGRGAGQAMAAALADAGLAPTDIGYINAHGTSTPMNDPSETAGIHRAFGAAGSAVPVSSTKSMTGHLVAACGAVEAIISVLAVREGIVPPTINLDSPDPSCALRHVPHAPQEHRVEHALTNAFGFGGSNGSLVVSRYR